ncbi:hypothetical protein K438DRAFT_1687823 [Mycena galopus ATCC 62051]|nr:hypothetical protein K438DRAFT_1693285 [Mycena galopus ATCC 62051]KAF8153471.1 hypothetical protein K438DRAFT_1687823 [Mycena galopus ATCC 62051]
MADEGPALEDLVDNDELSYFEEDHLDLLNISGGCMSEPAEILTGQDHSSELIMGQDTVEIPMLDEEMPAASLTFKFLMNIQLVLILFLALSWLYNHFDSGK